MIDIKKLTVDELWNLYAQISKRLTETGEIRTKNITGERGEKLVIDLYKKTPNLPKLQLAPKGTRNIDAISRNGERYAIKTIRLPNKTTGVFYGLGNPDNVVSEKKFEHLIIVILNENYELDKVIDMDWMLFLENLKWHSRMQAFNISLNKSLLQKSKIVFSK